MTGTVRNFQSGQIIFQEGEPSTSAFLIVQGKVELTKVSSKGAVRLAILKPGELFGEMGVLDNSPRSATAKAVGKVSVKEIQAVDFVRGVQEEPELATKVMSKLVERLRNADDMLVGAHTPSSASGQKSTALQMVSTNAPTTGETSRSNQPAIAAKKAGFFARLFGRKQGRSAPLEIIIADLGNDQERKATKDLYDGLSAVTKVYGEDKIALRLANNAFVPDRFEDSPVFWRQCTHNGQNWLRELEGDILVWGRLSDDRATYELRFSSVTVINDERAGRFAPYDVFYLPAAVDQELLQCLFVVCLGAMIPSTNVQLNAARHLLSNSIDWVRNWIHQPPRDLDGKAQAGFLACFATTLASLAQMTGEVRYFEEAESAYANSLRATRRVKSDLLQAIIRRHMGATQYAWSEKGGDNSLLEAAAESFEEASHYFNRENFSEDWATLQSAKALTLFKLDQKTGSDDEVHLKACVAAYQGALQVFSASATPYKWGEAKHHLGRALLILGRQNRSPDLLARAAEASKEALVVRSREKVPTQWAATQNNLGSALFMLAQYTKKRDTVEAAKKAFTGAIEVYRGAGAQRRAAVIEKNLVHVDEMLADMGSQDVEIESAGEFEWDDMNETAPETDAEAQKLEEEELAEKSS